MQSLLEQTIVREIAFTHSTSEGMNIIAHMLSDKGIVISNELEFPSY